MRNKRGSGKLIRIVILVLIAAVLGFAGWQIYGNYKGGEKARTVMSDLEMIIPDLGKDTGVMPGGASEELAAINLEGIDIVGVFEVPSLDINAPVTGKDQGEEYFASWLDGSPVSGNFKLIGGKDDLFRRISRLKPGDRAYFTDIDGNRYSYEVRTQYHLKKWDVGDNEFQLCTESDSDTYFVVGCSPLF